FKKGMTQFDDEQATSISKLGRKTELNHMFLQQIMQRYISFDELTKEAVRYTMDERKIQYDREDISRLFDAFLNLEYFYEVPKILARLNNMDIDVGILSNGNDNMLRPLIDNSELGENINTVMSVNEIKQYKPSPASYRSE